MSSQHCKDSCQLSEAAMLTSHPPMRNHDGSVMLNDRGEVVYRSQYLSTHPLRKDCMERPSPHGKLTYVTGDGVIRTMNMAFGYSGWSTEITREREVICEMKNKGNWVVGYVATVRVSLQNGASHEDCGTGECINESKLKAIDVAFKAAVTDAMKRAARHFGERLGNALYQKGTGINMAPKDNKTALRMLEQSEANDLFGDQKQLHAIRAQAEHGSSREPSQSSVATAPVINTTSEFTSHAAVNEPTHAKPVYGNGKSVTPHQTRPAEAIVRNTTPAASYPKGFSKASDVLVTPQNSSRTSHGGYPALPSGNQARMVGTAPPTASRPAQFPPRASPPHTTSPHMSRPVSSDGTQLQYAPLDEATNRNPSPPSFKRPSPPQSTDPDAKRSKHTRNPYDKH